MYTTIKIYSEMAAINFSNSNHLSTGSTTTNKSDITVLTLSLSLDNPGHLLTNN